jgi:hypothetical protein
MGGWEGTLLKITLRVPRHAWRPAFSPEIACMFHAIPLSRLPLGRSTRRRTVAP